MRMVTIEPGGVFGPIHDHKDRPGMVYILQGTITDYRNGVAKEYEPGVGWPEDKNTTHWLENRRTTSAVEISFDLGRVGWGPISNPVAALKHAAVDVRLAPATEPTRYALKLKKVCL
jgi:Cupin domain